MSHNRKLGKPTDQRIAMLRAMTTYLLETVVLIWPFSSR